MNINIYSENICETKKIDEDKAISVASQVFKYYMSVVGDDTALAGQKYDTVAFDILYCLSDKTHELNREYRNKDYPADIITFAIFADDDNKFIFDGEVNLGEIIIALDKVEEESVKKGKTFEEELYFLIAHGITHLLGFDHQTEEDYNFVVGLQNDALKVVEYDKV